MSVAGCEERVPVPGREEEVPVPGRGEQVPVPGREEQVPVPGREAPSERDQGDDCTTFPGKSEPRNFDVREFARRVLDHG